MVLKPLSKLWVRVFAIHKDDLGYTELVQHQIHPGDASPVRERHYPIPPMIFMEMRVLLEDMLEKKVILQSSSPWTAPIIKAQKDGNCHFCVDYNSFTLKDAFPSLESRRP